MNASPENAVLELAKDSVREHSGRNSSPMVFGVRVNPPSASAEQALWKVQLKLWSLRTT